MKLQEQKRRSPAPKAAELVRPTEQPRTSWFDPELEFTAEDKDRMVAEILNEKPRNRLYYSFEFLTLFPDLGDRLNFDELQKTFRQTVESDERGMGKFAELLCRATFSDYEIGDIYAHRGGVFEIPDRAACLLLGGPYAKDDRVWLREEFERRYPLQQDGAAAPAHFNQLTAEKQNALVWFKIALPQEFGERVVIADTDDALKLFRQNVDRARKGRMEWSTVLWTAFQLAALSATDIEYTPSGQLKFLQQRKAVTQGSRLPDRPEV